MDIKWIIMVDFQCLSAHFYMYFKCKTSQKDMLEVSIGPRRVVHLLNIRLLFYAYVVDFAVACYC